ncbi:MAG TPA: aminotransferase class V-fold PLP-dependent enzyme, partial [Chitinophagaceae bacterium]|nr:aminotransferase class V-fold PLP-dependent enzyme [Chitinophagaceae bacterium]
EKGMRSGTLNVPGIAGFGKACDICMNELQHDEENMKRLRNKLENALLNIDGATVNGDRYHRLPHVTNMSFNIADGENLVIALNEHIAISTGSACMSASLEPSYVLKALGLNDSEARSGLRFSLGRHTTEEEIDYTIEQVIHAVNKLRKISQQVEL